MTAAFVVVVAGMRAAESIINPLLLAIFLSVLSAPAYFGLLKRNIPNWLALLTVVGVLTGLVLGVLWIVLSSVVSFSDRQEHYAELLRERTASITAPIDRWLLEDDDQDEERNQDLPTGTDADDPPAENSEEPVPALPDVDQAIGREAEGSGAEESPSERSEDLVAEADGDSVPEGANGEEVQDGDDLSGDDVGSAAIDVDSGSGLVSLAPDVADYSNQAFGFPQNGRMPPKDKKGWEQLLSNQFNPRMLISLTLTLMTELGQILSNAFLILLTVIFILLEVGTFRRKIGVAFTKDDEMAARAAQVVTSIRHYIVIKTWVSLGTGIFIALWLKFLGVPYAGLWGLLSFLFNFIPNIGSIIAAVPAVLIAWLELSTMPAFAAAFGFVLVNVVLGNFIEPKWMGKGLGLSPLVVFCSLVFWGWILGPVGMLLSVPLTKTVRIALDGFDDTRFVATLLSD